MSNFEPPALETWAAEAEKRWGHTDAYRQSTRRTASYGDEDWKAMRNEETRFTPLSSTC